MFPNAPTPTPGPARGPATPAGGANPGYQTPSGAGSPGYSNGILDWLRQLVEQANQWVTNTGFPAFNGALNQGAAGVTSTLNRVPDYGPQLRQGIVNGLVSGGNLVNPGGLGSFTGQPTASPQGRSGLQSPARPPAGRYGTPSPARGQGARAPGQMARTPTRPGGPRGY